MELQVHIEAHVVVSFGLEVFATAMGGFVFPGLEVIMNNLNAIYTSLIASVWCGVALLRSPAKISQPEREMGMSGRVLPAKSERGRFDSSPPHQFLSQFR